MISIIKCFVIIRDSRHGYPKLSIDICKVDRIESIEKRKISRKMSNVVLQVDLTINLLESNSHNLRVF